ncbi:MAG TPA: hypothetical protein VFQ05_15905 [Candidatus Eisenbacteria bacterium]|nr:hypothetical protein [Candidatus Eisenbacteria bacterium]
MIKTRMVKRWTAIALMLGFAVAMAPQAGAATYYGFTVGVNNAPPAPRVVLGTRPDLVAIPGTLVYAVDNTDYDVFRYNGRYYLYNDGYWYRSSRTSGPYMVVDVRSVPQPILRVPSKSWKSHPHGGPPGQMKKKGRH